MFPCDETDDSEMFVSLYMIRVCSLYFVDVIIVIAIIFAILLIVIVLLLLLLSYCYLVSNTPSLFQAVFVYT